MLQEQAERQELQEELRSREEVVQRRETCLKQKQHLEVKKLRTSRVSMCKGFEHNSTTCMFINHWYLGVVFIFNFSGSESGPAACVCAVGICGGEPAEQ